MSDAAQSFPAEWLAAASAALSAVAAIVLLVREVRRDMAAKAAAQAQLTEAQWLITSYLAATARLKGKYDDPGRTGQIDEEAINEWHSESRRAQIRCSALARAPSTIPLVAGIMTAAADEAARAGDYRREDVGRMIAFVDKQARAWRDLDDEISALDKRL